MGDVTRALCLVLCSVLGCTVDASAPDPTDGETDRDTGGLLDEDGSVRDAADVDGGRVREDGGRMRGDGGRMRGDGGAPEDAGRPRDAGVSGARALGSVSGVAEGVACGPGAPPGARCTRATVHCPGLDDLDAIVAISEPTGPAHGTIVIHKGGDGTEFRTNNADAYLSAGLRVVAVRWSSAWEVNGLLEAACRPATLFQWVFDGVHGGDPAVPYCAEGHSGGGGAFSYALAHYGLESIFDYVQVTSGPPFSRVDYSCAPETYTGPLRTLCPELPDAPIAYGNPSRIDFWEGTSTCGSGSPSRADLTAWAADSIVSEGADYDYPNTLVSFFDCASGPNETAGGAYFYAREITSDSTVACYTDCRGEGLGPTATEDLRTEMLTECHTRHTR